MNMDPGQITSCGGADFYVVIKEPGHTDSDLPVWTCTEPGGISFYERPAAVIERKDLSEIPGAFHLLNGHCHGNFVSQQLINYQMGSGCGARGIPNTE